MGRVPCHYDAVNKLTVSRVFGTHSPRRCCCRRHHGAAQRLTRTAPPAAARPGGHPGRLTSSCVFQLSETHLCHCGLTNAQPLAPASVCSQNGGSGTPVRCAGGIASRHSRVRLGVGAGASGCTRSRCLFMHSRCAFGIFAESTLHSEDVGRTSARRAFSSAGHGAKSAASFSHRFSA